MRHKLALMIALAGFAVVTALGVGMAGADATRGLGASQATEPIPAVPAAPATSQCSNGVDDDGDGLVDAADPGCAYGPEEDSQPTAEANPAEAQPHAPQVQAGSSLEAAEAQPAGGAERNRGIAAPGSRGNGGVSAPSATAGVQPAAAGGSGGSQFGSGGAPTEANPSATIASFGPAPIGVPNFVIDSFEIPPFLLPIYQACGTEYGIPWEVLASINKIETAFGTNLGTSSAGAMGWMQFLPSSWQTYGIDANGDGRKDPYNPVDAICAAARYLKIGGGDSDLYKAIFAYNHADWYVQEVLATARAYGKLPANLVGSLTGLTEGAHFPVAADSRYADDLSTRAALREATPQKRASYGNAADVVSSSPTRRGIDIFAAAGSPVVAVHDGVIRKLGTSKKLGRFLILEDAYGNRFTYAELGSFLRSRHAVVGASGKERRVPVESQDIRPRLYALPGRAGGAQRRAGTQVDQTAASGADTTLKVGSRVIAGTVLARVGETESGVDPHVNFAIRPAGRGAPKIDPKPILDGWKLLEATAIYRASGKSPFARDLGIGGMLLLSKEALQRRVLADKHLHIRSCGRDAVSTGQVDRRVLAMLEYLAAKGFDLSLSPQCDQGRASASSAASRRSDDAVEIAAIDGVPVNGHQGHGTLADQLIKSVLKLQGTMHPQRVVSLEDLPGTTSFALPSQRGSVQVGYSPAYEATYVNPFLSATTGRIDQGVDFTGIGPIAAVGDARILQTGAPGWPEGGGVLYQLLDGPRAGQAIFVFEGVEANVHAGQRVSAGQRIATFVPGGSIEMGFADTAGTPLSHAEYVEGKETVWGREMARFLAGLGASGLSSGYSELPAAKWNRLARRLGEISNPTVPSKPSKYALPDR